MQPLASVGEPLSVQEASISAARGVPIALASAQGLRKASAASRRQKKHGR